MSDLGAGSRYLLLQTLQSLPAFVNTYQTMECFLLFNVSNPTGHYKLELNKTCQFAVAQRLLLLDRWEAVMNKRNGRVDISSRGCLGREVANVARRYWC